MHFTRPAVTTVVLVLGFALQSRADIALPSEPAPAGLCFATNAESNERILVPLESTEVILDVKPGLLEAEVVQTFTNRTANALEATYLYPLPSGATLTHFELRFRDRVVRSVVREKGEARVIYDAAKAEGKKAVLLEQHDPSLFSTAVANFLPGETVHVALRFLQPLTLSADAVDVRFPMVTGEKYFPGDAMPGQEGNAAPNPVRRSGSPILPNHVYAFDVQIAGLPVRKIESSSHRIRVEHDAGATGHHRVSLVDEITIPDRDFVLRIETQRADTAQATLVTQRTGTGDYGALTVFPPRLHPVTGAPPPARDILFLLDRSSSMNGSRFVNAKQGLLLCLDALRPNDRFQIVAFDHEPIFFTDDWTPANAIELAAARASVENLAIRGGTDVQSALAAGFEKLTSLGREHIIILLTDGDVGNERTLLNLVENRIGDARIFALGIGHAPNVALVTKMAALGRGQARFVHDDASVAREFAELFATLDAPVLTDVELALVDAQGGTIAYAAFPEKISDVFLHRPIQTTYRTTNGSPAAVVLTGMERGLPVSHRFAVSATPLRGDGLEKQFGMQLCRDTAEMLRRATTDFERSLVRKELLETALQFQLVTELTSRVAVDEEIVRPNHLALETQHVAQYRASDQPPAASKPMGASPDENVVTLSPFEVSGEGETGYTAATTLAGNRLNTELRDTGSAISVVTVQFLRDIGAVNNESLLAYIGEPLDDSAGSRPTAENGTLGGLPIATVLDPATVERITLDARSDGGARIDQAQAGGSTPSMLRIRLGDEGLLAAALKWAGVLDTDHSLSALAMFSADSSDHNRWGGYLAARKRFDATRLDTSFQWRDLRGYGTMRLLRASLSHEFSDLLAVKATVAWHRIERNDPRQFRRGFPGAVIDGLGFFNLDALTAETSEFGDTIVQVELGGSDRLPSFRYAWGASVSWHRQDAAWLSPLPHDSVAPRRTTHRFALSNAFGFLDDRLNVAVDAALATHATPGETASRRRTGSTGAEISWDAKNGASLFANWSAARALPWLPRGEWQPAAPGLLAVSTAIERRTRTETGVRWARDDGRLTATVSAFREEITQRTLRDWAWERDHAGAGFTTFVDGRVRGEASTRLVPRMAHAGWHGALDFMPTRTFVARATVYRDMKDDDAYPGGDTLASLFARYEFDSGILERFSAACGLSYRDSLVFDDGFTLQGGLRCDVILGYRFFSTSRGHTELQLKLGNLSARTWQPTRFTPDRGRESVLTITHHW